MTDSMRRALEETERRREKQLQFNEEHGITARGVTKEVRDLIDGVMQRADTQAEPDQLQVSPGNLKDVKKHVISIQKAERKKVELGKKPEVQQTYQHAESTKKIKRKARIRKKVL